MVVVEGLAMDVEGKDRSRERRDGRRVGRGYERRGGQGAGR